MESCRGKWAKVGVAEVTAGGKGSSGAPGFGFGEPTGVELRGGAVGVAGSVNGREEKEESEGRWHGRRSDSPPESAGWL